MKPMKHTISFATTLLCLLLLAALILLALPGCRQTPSESAKTVRGQPATGAAPAGEVAKRRGEKFDLRKLRTSLKPGASITTEALPDEVTAGDGLAFRLVTEGVEESGAIRRAYYAVPYHFMLVTNQGRVVSVKVSTVKASAEPLEVYPDVWLAKTTKAEMDERFGEPMKDLEGRDLGLPCIQSGLVRCRYDEASSVLIELEAESFGEGESKQ